jgi:hypothetical protein
VDDAVREVRAELRPMEGEAGKKGARKRGARKTRARA